MSYSRYSRRSTFINDNEGYRKKFFKDARGVHQIQQYDTAVLNFPDSSEITDDLSLDTETWQVGTRMDKLAHQYYGDASLWWLIAWFNKKPTEGSWSIGDLVYIPQPADVAINIFERSQ
jgi:hypothetical protein